MARNNKKIAEQKLKEKTIKTHIEEGVKKIRIGQYEAAIQNFDEALKIDPKNVRAYHNRALQNII